MLSTALFLVTVACAAAAVAGRRRWPRPVALGLASAAAAALVAWVAVCGTFDLRKVVGTAVMPAGLVWLALLVAAWWRSDRGRPAMWLWALWLAYAVAGNGFVGGVVLGWLERPFAAVDPWSGPSLDAIVVLGGGVRAGRDGRPALGESGDRPVLAVRLYRAGRAPLLVTTGPEVLLPDRVSTVPALTAKLWRGLGVPAAAIVEAPGPRTTAEEIETIRRLIGERGWGRVGVVTSGYHMRRAITIAGRAGVDLEPLPASLVGGSLQLEPQGLLPSGEGFAAVHRGCWEIVGLILAAAS